MRKIGCWILLTCIFVVGCSGTSTQITTTVPNPTPAIQVNTPIPQANTFDPQKSSPCELLTKEEASRILGISAEKIQQGEVPAPKDSNFSMCGFLGDAEKGTGISISLYGKGDAAKAKEIFAASKSALEKRKRLMPIAALGEEAFWSGAFLMVQKGAIVFSVAVNKSLTEPDLELSKQAAAKIIARIE